jgi:tetratricopeptide (TPR) repeat protein
MVTTLVLELADTLVTTGDWDAVRSLLDGLPPEALADPLTAARARFQRLSLAVNTDPTLRFESIDAGLAELNETFERLGDERDRIKALGRRAFVLFARGRAMEASDLLATAVELGRRSETALWIEVAEWIPVFDAFGPRPVPDAIDRAEAMLALGAGHPGMTALVLLGLGASRVAHGESERGLGELADGVERLVALGNVLWTGGGLQLSGYARMSIGDLEGAEADLRQADAILAAIDETGFRSTVEVLLAKARIGLGHPEDARALNELGRSLAAQDDFLTQVLWRSVEARLASLEGEHERALALGTEAVAIVRTSDYLELTGDALLDLAEVQRAAGDRASALDSANAAVELYRRKGIRPGEQRADRILAMLAGRS